MTRDFQLQKIHIPTPGPNILHQYGSESTTLVEGVSYQERKGENKNMKNKTPLNHSNLNVCSLITRYPYEVKNPGRI